MNRILVCAVALSLLAGVSDGAGTANAKALPSLVGKTYAKATGLLSQWGMKYEVSTVVGTELARNDCLVANQVLRPASRWGSQYIPAKLLLSLDCTAAVATAAQAGKSAGSPGGRAEKQERTLEWWRTNTAAGQAWCKDSRAEYPHWDWSLIKGCPQQ